MTGTFEFMVILMVCHPEARSLRRRTYAPSRRNVVKAKYTDPPDRKRRGPQDDKEKDLEIDVLLNISHQVRSSFLLALVGNANLRQPVT